MTILSERIFLFLTGIALGYDFAVLRNRYGVCHTAVWPIIDQCWLVLNGLRHWCFCLYCGLMTSGWIMLGNYLNGQISDRIGQELLSTPAHGPKDVESGH